MNLPAELVMGQMLIGAINGSFYALMSVGLALIFGMLNIINFAHGAFYMVGAVLAWILLNHAGVGYWWSLIAAPAIVSVAGCVLERLMLRRTYRLDHVYGLLLTLGMALVMEGIAQNQFGSAGRPYPIPSELGGALDLGFMQLPQYRVWVIVASAVVCLGTWLLIEKTHLGSYLRAATENPELVRAFGIRVPRMITLTYALGVGLAAFAGVMAAPILQVSPHMGSNLIIVVFAVVVIGGMGSLLGSVISGFALGLIEAITKLFYPEAATTAVFIVMAIVLLLRPNGLLGRAQ